MIYKITHKGNTFLSYYDQMKELLPVGLEENYAEESYKLEHLIIITYLIAVHVVF